MLVVERRHGCITHLCNDAIDVRLGGDCNSPWRDHIGIPCSDRLFAPDGVGTSTVHGHGGEALKIPLVGFPSLDLRQESAGGLAEVYLMLLPLDGISVVKEFLALHFLLAAPVQ